MILTYQSEILREIENDDQLAIGLFDYKNLKELYTTNLFKSWLGSDKQEPDLPAYIPNLNIDRLKKKLVRKNQFNSEIEIKENNRSKIIKLQIRQTSSSHLLVKAIDYSKEKEVEYLLDSYVKMSEKDKKRLEESLSIIEKQKAHLIETNEALAKERNSIQLRALQAVINPHFVSNCLASIQRFIVDNDVELSVNYLSYFGKLMRMSFEQSYYDYVSLDEIIQLLNTYVAIEKIRIRHNWSFVIEIEKQIETNNIKIPPMLIQPFLENAIWHGINHKTTGGLVQINLELINEITLKCTIEDNGAGRIPDEEVNDKSHKTALHSLNVTGERLDIMWKDHQQNHKIIHTDLKTNEGIPCGTKVELLIPITF